MDDDQERFLREASSIVTQEARQMQRYLDEGNLEEALKHASSMISELKTSTMSPKTYYELYMQVFDNLGQLKGAFMDEYRRGKKMEELYQMVQCNPNILPRLYLLITVGAVYIESRQAPAKTILKDLIEMTKGLQHPVRGLFLRYYLNPCRCHQFCLPILCCFIAFMHTSTALQHYTTLSQGVHPTPKTQ